MMQSPLERLQKHEIADADQREFDIAMTDRVQAGFTPNEEDNISPIDGSLTPDATDALENLWRANIAGAESIAGRYANFVKNMPNIDPSDLMQEAHFGLFYSALVWDKNRNDRFFPLAYKNMRGYVRRYISNKGSTIYLPDSALDRSALIADTVQELREETGTLPSDDSVAHALGITAEKVARNRTNVGRVMTLTSIDIPATNDGSDQTDQMNMTSPLDVADDSSHNRSIQEVTVDQIIAVLSDESSPLSKIEQRVLQLRYLGEFSVTVSQAATELGRSEFGIRQIQKRAIAKILNSDLADKLKDFR